MSQEDIRAHLGWLIYCVSQGYVKAEDATKADLLVMADEVLGAIND